MSERTGLMSGGRKKYCTIVGVGSTFDSHIELRNRFIENLAKQALITSVPGWE